MKMIRHKAVGKDVAIRNDELFYLVKKILVVGGLKKDRLAVVAPIVNVI
jgi:hypothetical protein